MSLAAEAFTQNVIDFCDWSKSERHDLMRVRQLLLSLMQSIPHLETFRGTSESDEDHERREHEGWKEDFAHLSDLPFQYYKVTFDPLNIEDEAIVGDLMDDLADIYGDLFEGLSTYKKGYKKEAISIWINSYFYHWGQHAASAVFAIDHFYRENQGSEQVSGHNSGGCAPSA